MLIELKSNLFWVFVKLTYIFPILQDLKTMDGNMSTMFIQLLRLIYVLVQVLHILGRALILLPGRFILKIDAQCVMCTNIGHVLLCRHWVVASIFPIDKGFPGGSHILRVLRC